MECYYDRALPMEAAIEVLNANIATSCEVTSGPDSDVGPCFALAFALEHNSSLSRLCLQCPRPSLAMACAEALKYNNTLKHMCWQGMPFGSEQAVIMIANSLKHNSTLETLDLRLCFGHVDDRVCLAMTDALMQNTTLCSLKLEYSDMRVQTAAMMAAAVLQSTSLHTFTIGSDSLDDQVGAILAGILQQNVSLKHFKLFGGNTGDNTGLVIVSALKTNVVLESLSLASCNMSEGIRDAMRDVILLQNVRIREIYPGYHLNDEDDAALREALERNKRLARGWCALVQLAKVSDGIGFHTLKELFFRQEVFKFFLPPLCTVTAFVSQFQEFPASSLFPEA